MSWSSAFTLAIINFVINVESQTNGYAQQTLSNGIELTVAVSGDSTDIRICCPNQDVWCGVGFGGSIMKDTYAIIARPLGDNQIEVEEYILGDKSCGTPVSDTKRTITLGDVYPTENGAGICGSVTRVTTKSDDTTIYDYPKTFSATVDTNIISALGTSSQYVGMESSSTVTTTFTYNPGTGSPTPAPTETNDQPNDKQTANAKSSVCFSSDSWVLTYPDFDRKQIDELQIYDKILTYDESDDKFFWDELLVKLHFDEDEFLNDVLVPMREFILNNGETLTMTDTHLLYIGHSGLHRADEVRLGDKLKVFDGSYVDVIGIKEVMKYPRNMITYNGNLVVNGVAISTFTDTIWGENENWGKYLRMVMKYGYSYNIWRYPAYYAAKLWTQYASGGFKDRVLKLYMDEKVGEDNDGKFSWFGWFWSYS